MDVVLLELLSALLRWLHVIAGMAWIGSSFYFIHLDLSLKPSPVLGPGVKGEAWQVHGGGFYHMVKFLVAPSKLPDELTWFKWEAYTTWLSGFALLVVVYYLSAELYLIDKNVLEMSAPMAALIAFLSLAAAWGLYELACRSPLAKYELLLSLLGFVFLVALTYAFTHVFSGRGAFTQIGAIIGTIMVANVFVVIIPNQKKIVEALLAGQEPEARLGDEGKTRSVHNNYLTLPVIFLMISNHYPLFFATKYNWIMVAIVLLMGPLIRHFFNERHMGKESPWWTWAVAAIGVIIIAWLMSLGPRFSGSSSAPPPTQVAAAQAIEIVTNRCSMCHAADPVWTGIVEAPKGVRLDGAETIARHAPLISLQAVRSDAMPPGNVTEMTAAERQILAAWIAAGAPAK
jgi:uncharacterized membrane protein